ncbi:MAG: carbamoyltransferase HypF [Acidobacteria bacterium RIFCSPLOWO2_02_FULL_67_36]|nr:MAG: carbamoyltransferase HypF [Acidobacteria bacterium RIFCSPLOWO2_02_FULL_67_36]OFW24456.1 MAG: carbamoyltransferase HypF [Acidobacteria bacterium RIFCSPLOWO2_12_FULL_66_21]
MRIFNFDHPGGVRLAHFPAQAPARLASAQRADPPGLRSMPPDLPICPTCLSELRDPSNRRYHYCFTNCAQCGPRFTIATAAPYDRARTTMAAFRMCAECQREFDTPGGRRFHALAACPQCGPSLFAVAPNGTRIETDDPVEEAARALLRGGIVALKGIGGFHLACDATSETNVQELRARKHHDEKPFAMMVSDVAQAKRLAFIGPEEERLLLSPERPVVIARRREPSPVAVAIAPHNPLLGLFVPYSALHHLLLDRVGRPLVMTSGNRSDEPMAYTNEEALTRLGGIADVLILHNREIVTRCDDSIARVVAGAPVVLRRSRGYAPRPVTLKRAVERPVLACGAVVANAFCLARGSDACLGPHMGNLDDLDTFTSYRETIDRLERFLGFEPEIVAHDLNPEYLATGYALSRAAAATIGVQHHHAHIASVMAEHGVEGPVIGVAYDGGGLGTDGTYWGGEVLVASYTSFERMATLRPIRLAGGELAIRQPWRTALAVVDDAFGGDAPLDSLAVFRNVSAEAIADVRESIASEHHAPPAHAAGRYFDAMGALGLGRHLASYEAQLALEWNAAAADDERGRYRYGICRSVQPWQVDLRPAVRDGVFELIGGESPPRVSARFHNTLAAATADLVRGVACIHGRLPVALSGGCFQHTRLVEGIVHELVPEFTMLLHATVPPGDGGIALGQAVVADAIVRAS